MGLFDRFRKKKDEDIVIHRAPVAPPPRQMTSTPPSRPVESEAEKERKRKWAHDLAEEFFDQATDALEERMETGNWDFGGPPAGTDDFRYADLPYIDHEGNFVLPFIKEGIDNVEEFWGGYAPDWDALVAAARYYDTFPEDHEELKKKYIRALEPYYDFHSDPGLCVKALQNMLIITMDDADKKMREMLPHGPDCLNVDEGHTLWCLNGDGFTRKPLPVINDYVNWCSHLRTDDEEFKKELEGVEDGVLRAMLSSFLDEHRSMLTRIFTRFSGCGQRLQKLKEGFIIASGMAAFQVSAFTHELADYEDVSKRYLHFTNVMETNTKLSGNGGRAGEKRAYLSENKGFNKTGVDMKRVASALSVCYCIDYAIDNLKAYYNFAWPTYEAKRTRLEGDIMNYLAFKNYTENDPIGAQYRDLSARILERTHAKYAALKDAMVFYIKRMAGIDDLVGCSLMYIARAQEPEEEIKWRIADALWRRLDLLDVTPCCTPELRYFTPWSVKPGQLLDMENSSKANPPGYPRLRSEAPGR